MSQLMFMPWYSVMDQEVIGSYTLHPYDTSIPNPALTNLAAETDAILSRYLERPYTTTDAQAGRGELPIERATVITTARFDQTELDPLQYVCGLCGISNREYVNDLYLCSENLRIVVQNYTAPITVPFDPLVEAPRKHGDESTGFSAGLFREVKPWHVAAQQIAGNRDYRLKFDGELARCLWSFFKGRGIMRSAWELNIFPALFSYYFANTDGYSFQSEAVYSQAAIERLFLGSGHSEERLIDTALAFIANKGIVFEPFPATTRNWQSITFQDPSRNTIPSRSIFEAWLRELTRLRNLFAHGNYNMTGNWVWSLRERGYPQRYPGGKMSRCRCSTNDHREWDR